MRIVIAYEAFRTVNLRALQPVGTGPQAVGDLQAPEPEGQGDVPGADEREFWQRAEDRNRQTAKVYDQLGLAEYEAIEGFVRWRPAWQG